MYQVQAVRTGSSGGVCNLNDLKLLREELTIARTGYGSAHVHQRGNYGHQANLDAQTCSLWTPRTPTHSRNVLGATVSGHAAYRVNVRLDGTVFGNLQLLVSSNSPFVAGCTATFQLSGRRVR